MDIIAPQRRSAARVKAFQHSPAEPLGYLETIFDGLGVPYEYAHLWKGDRIWAGDATHLVFLGGPMSVNDEETHPWIAEEKDLIRRATKKGIPVLGICLGAQLIASAHGATVYRFINETGWRPVSRAVDATGVFQDLPDLFHVFQMHGETFHLPVGGRLQCTGSAIRHQGFRLMSALGLQFHLEMTCPLIQDWIKDLPNAKKERIMRDTDRCLDESNQLCRVIAEEFILGCRQPR
jgi:GMP synthase-like glutamine amidotransferase